MRTAGRRRTGHLPPPVGAAATTSRRLALALHDGTLPANERDQGTTDKALSAEGCSHGVGCLGRSRARGRRRCAGALRSRIACAAWRARARSAFMRVLRRRVRPGDRDHLGGPGKAAAHGVAGASTSRSHGPRATRDATVIIVLAGTSEVDHPGSRAECPQISTDCTGSVRPWSMRLVFRLAAWMVEAAMFFLLDEQFADLDALERRRSRRGAVPEPRCARLDRLGRAFRHRRWRRGIGARSRSHRYRRGHAPRAMIRRTTRHRRRAVRVRAWTLGPRFPGYYPGWP
ncbi:hypothetical protein ACRAWF_38360 [Streptomyces sp. L7]